MGVPAQQVLPAPMTAPPQLPLQEVVSTVAVTRKRDMVIAFPGTDPVESPPWGWSLIRSRTNPRLVFYRSMFDERLQTVEYPSPELQRCSESLAFPAPPPGPEQAKAAAPAPTLTPAPPAPVVINVNVSKSRSRSPRKHGYRRQAWRFTTQQGNGAASSTEAAASDTWS